MTLCAPLPLSALLPRGIVGARALLTVTSPYVTVTVAPGGTYSLVAQTPAWTFAGTIGHLLANLASDTGSDAPGGYSEITFTHADQNGTAPRR